jgi:hypothetical protein
VSEAHDWIAPYPTGDERNAQHRADFDRYRRVYPATPMWEAQQYADAKLAARTHSVAEAVERTLGYPGLRKRLTEIGNGMRSGGRQRAADAIFQAIGIIQSLERDHP